MGREGWDRPHGSGGRNARLLYCVAIVAFLWFAWTTSDETTFTIAPSPSEILITTSPPSVSARPATRPRVSSVVPMVETGDTSPSDDEATETPQPSREVRARKGGRDGIDHSNHHIAFGPDGVKHAWLADDYKTFLAEQKLRNSTVGLDSDVCHGVSPSADCVDQSAVDYFRRHILLGIATGKEGSFRVEVSQCSWLAHFPPENVFVYTDVMPSPPMTPHHWVEQGLPDGIAERDGDLFSDTVKTGYIKQVRNAGMGYSVGWVIAQFRFGSGIQHMLDAAAAREGTAGQDIRWIMLVDDDTIVNINNLVKRVNSMDANKPWYLSRTGWGGAGHLYSLGAMGKFRGLSSVQVKNSGVEGKQEMSGLQECIHRWFVRQFRASDTMLLKCGRHLKMNVQKEGTMSHCPASTARDKLTDKNQITFHGKKDYYPPVLLTTFRTNLYYRSMYCRDKEAMKLAVSFSSCAYGNCKHPKCTKQFDKEREARWLKMSQNNTLRRFPWKELGIGL